jgi:hypothetical protein
MGRTGRSRNLGPNAALAMGRALPLYRRRNSTGHSGAHMKMILGLAAIAAGALVATGATAYPFGGTISAPEVAKVLQAKGYKAEVGVDDDGDPRVKSAADGTNFTVFFYGCKHTPKCTSLTFQSGFHIEGGLTAEKINGWNRDNRFIKGWLDKVNDPYGEMDIDAEDGFTSEALGSYIDDWVNILPSFKTYIGF